MLQYLMQVESSRVEYLTACKFVVDELLGGPATVSHARGACILGLVLHRRGPVAGLLCAQV